MSFIVYGSDAGTGMPTASTGSALATVTPHSSTQIGDLIVAVCYMEGDPYGVSDAGNGWLILDRAYDVSVPFGLFIAVCVSSRNGSSGHAGINLPASMAWTLASYLFSTAILTTRNPILKWDLANARGSAAGLTATASATALPFPAMRQSGTYGLGLGGRGYNNGGTTRTVGAISVYPERIDTGQASPPHGVALNRKWVQGNDIDWGQQTSNISAACVNRAGVRCFIPITGMMRDNGQRNLTTGRYR
jgi:hypothetical protein